MAEEPRLNDELESFAAALSGLVPRSSETSRDRLMYEAGQAAALAKAGKHRIALRFWRASSALSTLTAACLGALMMSGFALNQQVVPKAAAPVEQPAIASVAPVTRTPQMVDSHSMLIVSTPETTELSYLKDRNLALAEGLDKVPTSPVAGSEEAIAPATYRELLRTLNSQRDFEG